MQTTICPPMGPGSPCAGCQHAACRHTCAPALILFCGALLIFGLIVVTSGCVPTPTGERSQPFETPPIDACLVVLVDMSGSFAATLDERGYETLLGVMDRFFNETAGAEARLMIGQLSAEKKAMLFEGRPHELRSHFRTPEELAEFLRRKSDPSGSPVYEAIARSLEYAGAGAGISEQTRLVTVVLSDLVDNSGSHERSASGQRMLSSLEQYQQAGGGIAFYCVAQSEVSRWRRIMATAGFEPGSYVIESTLVAQPQLPSFD